MSKQPRRSVSVKGLTYQRIEAYLKHHGGTASGFLEELISSKIGEPSDEERRKFDETLASRHAEAEAPKRAEEPDATDEFDGYVPPHLLL